MNEQKPPIKITVQHWNIFQVILEKNVPEYDVYAFGSRVTGKARPYLPWKIDVIDWASTSEAFRKIIQERTILLQKGVMAR